MNWELRKQPAAWTSPSGARTEFKYENVSANINKRDEIIEFPDYAGALVKNFGLGASSYPLLCIFWGADHDREADAFLVLLAEPGSGILEHPFYGRFENAVPFGAIARRDDLKTAANQTIFEVNFVISAAFQFPGSLISAVDAIEFDILSFEEAQIAAFAENLKISSAREKISLVDSVIAKLKSVKKIMDAAIATVAEIESEFNAAFSLIENNINTLVGQPLTLARKIIDLIKLPSRAASRISATLSAYGNLLTATISDAQGLFVPGIGNSVNNQFFNSELFARATFSAMLESSKEVADATRDISGQSLKDFITTEPEEIPAFTTKNEIVFTINFLDEQFAILNSWDENNRESLDLLDSDASSFNLNNAAAAVAGFLVRISFSARQERIIVLGSPHSIIELCGELYGIIDNALDFFDMTNDLTGDEIIELPRGRRIKYYV